MKFGFSSLLWVFFSIHFWVKLKMRLNKKTKLISWMKMEFNLSSLNTLSPISTQ